MSRAEELARSEEVLKHQVQRGTEKYTGQDNLMFAL